MPKPLGGFSGGVWVRMLLFGLILRAHSKCTQIVAWFWVDSGLRNQRSRGAPMEVPHPIKKCS